MNFGELAANLGLEEEEFRELVELLLATAPNDLQKLRSALDTNDTGAVAAAAHTLKGSTANLGFAELAEIARRIEEQARLGLLVGVGGMAGELQQGLNDLAARLG